MKPRGKSKILSSGEFDDLYCQIKELENVNDQIKLKFIEELLAKISNLKTLCEGISSEIELKCINCQITSLENKLKKILNDIECSQIKKKLSSINDIKKKTKESSNEPEMGNKDCQTWSSYHMNEPHYSHKGPYRVFVEVETQTQWDELLYRKGFLADQEKSKEDQKKKINYKLAKLWKMRDQINSEEVKNGKKLCDDCLICIDNVQRSCCEEGSSSDDCPDKSANKCIEHWKRLHKFEVSLKELERELLHSKSKCG